MGLYDYPVFQVLLTLMLNLGYLIFIIKADPFESPSNAAFEYVNEGVTILTIYILMLFTGEYLDPDDPLSDSVGSSIIYLTLANFAVNVLFMIINILLVLRKKCVLCMFKR